MGTRGLGRQARSYLGVPIVVGDEAIGVISVQSSTEDGRFGDVDVRLLTTIAANIGSAIQNARLYREAQRRADEMAVLADVGREISATLDLGAAPGADRRARPRPARGRHERRLPAEPDGRTFRAIAAVGERRPMITRTTVINLGEGIIGSLAVEATAEIVNDVLARRARGRRSREPTRTRTTSA